MAGHSEPETVPLEKRESQLCKRGDDSMTPKTTDVAGLRLFYREAGDPMFMEVWSATRKLFPEGRWRGIAISLIWGAALAGVNECNRLITTVDYNS